MYSIKRKIYRTPSTGKTRVSVTISDGETSVTWSDQTTQSGIAKSVRYCEKTALAEFEAITEVAA